VNEVLTYQWNLSERLSLINYLNIIGFACKSLWKKRFDIALLPRYDFDIYHATILIYLSGAHWRIGFSEKVNDRKWKINAGFDCMLSYAFNDTMLRHEVERGLDLLRYLKIDIKDDSLELWLEHEDESFADQLLTNYKLCNSENLIALSPSGGGSPLKQWPLENYVELGLWLQREHHARILVVGGIADMGIGRELASKLGPSAIDASGKTTLKQTAALLKRCCLFIGNDSGPMHIASAVGAPVVGIFGPSCPHRFMPWNNPRVIVREPVPCSPCITANHNDRCEQCIWPETYCLSRITLNHVKKAVHTIC
jgi:heptosyltransferase-2